MSKLTNISDEELQVGEEKDVTEVPSWEETYWQVMGLIHGKKGEGDTVQLHGFIGSEAQARIWITTLKVDKILLFCNIKDTKEGIEQSYLREYANVSKAYNRTLQ